VEHSKTFKLMKIQGQCCKTQHKHGGFWGGERRGSRTKFVCDGEQKAFLILKMVRVLKTSYSARNESFLAL